MGLFKGIKDLKGMLGAAPGLLDQANQLTANARAMQENAAAAHAELGHRHERWNKCISANPVVARQFNSLYTGRI